MIQTPKTCYSLHKDKTIRMHIPIYGAYDTYGKGGRFIFTDPPQVLNLKEGEVQILARDNKILVEDIERINSNMLEFIDKPFTAAASDKFQKELTAIKQQLMQEMTMTPEKLFQLLIENNENEEHLFKFKLEAFKLDHIKNAKSKKIKTDIRKAKTLIELFKLI